MIEQLFFELIQVAIGTRICLSHTPSADEWGELYAMAKKQSLIGICFAAVQKLQCNDHQEPRTKNPQSEPTQNQEPRTQNLDEVLYLTWMGMAAKIQQRNEVVNRQCGEVQAKLSAEGFRSYIMKGQAVGTLYGSLAGLRQSGDIDVYLEGGLDKVLAYARTFGEVGKVNELEMSVPVYDDTEVEFHYRPFIMRNPFKNAKLQVFFKICEDKNFSNSLILDKEKNLSICAPTIEFNLVHQLVHTYHHFITEGVGLRQLMDYHFVLKHEMEVENGSNVKKVREVVESLGLKKFASALMWVMQHVFGLGMIGMPWIPNQRDGEFLLKEIMMSGNFGHTDERAMDIQTSRWKSFWFVNGKTFRFWRFDHWAWFWSPVWRMYHFAWRKMKGFK